MSRRNASRRSRKSCAKPMPSMLLRRLAWRATIVNACTKLHPYYTMHWLTPITTQLRDLSLTLAVIERKLFDYVRESQFACEFVLGDTERRTQTHTYIPPAAIDQANLLLLRAQSCSRSPTGGRSWVWLIRTSRRCGTSRVGTAVNVQVAINVDFRPPSFPQALLAKSFKTSSRLCSTVV